MSQLRFHRERAGLTQRELAERAGVSRQLIGSVETGRHVPRVDAALGLARALDTDVASLFATDDPTPAVDVVTGGVPRPGLVRLARVGERLVTAPARVTAAGFDSADATVEVDGALDPADGAPGFVVAGCEPGLLVLEQLLRERGLRGLAATTSSATARTALAEGRTHAAVVHGSQSWARSHPPRGVVVHRLARWQVGLCAPSDAPPRWWQEALEGRGPVIQREEGAGVQRSFVSAAGETPGPVVGSHLEAALRSLATGLPAVTIEPAALAVGAVFHPLDVHASELWVDGDAVDLPQARLALQLLVGADMLRSLRGVGGYDLAEWGEHVA
jgi:DNA-binding XRE family transcriptional regulator